MLSGHRRSRVLFVLITVAALGISTGCSDLLEEEPTAAPADTPPALEDPFDVVADLERFWGEQSRRAGVPYESVAADRVLALDSDDVAEATCDGEPVTYDDVEDNAFVASCEEGLLVAWDTAMFEDLRRRYGPVGPATILAHEWGHVLQFSSGMDEELTDVDSEQQADCVAGAWVATQPFDGGDLDAAVIAVAGFRDEPGTSPTEDDPHGLAFDRVRAFQEGYDRGVEHCIGYVDQPPTLTQFEFGDAEEEANGGNLPFEETVDLASSALDRFYTGRIAGFEALGSDVVSDLGIDDLETIEVAHDEIGDTATTFMMADLWAEEAQRILGEESGRDEFGRFLQRTCMTGGWLGSVFNGEDEELELSPGDFDEAIFALARLLGAERTDEAIDADGGLFETVAALRQGVTEGVESCLTPER